MKYLLVIFDGMADEPLEELGGKTPMQVARKPYMDDIARLGSIGAVTTTPAGMDPGSDITNMAILGYDPRKYYKGRGPIEAASLEIPFEETDVVFRTNLVSTDGSLMLDSSAGHVSTEEAHELIDLIDQKLSTRTIKFYPGVSYRHIMVWRSGSVDVHCTAPYKIQDKPFAEHLPEGDGEDTLKRMIYDSLELLDQHPINRARRDRGELPANMIWFWAQGRKPEIPSFFNTNGVKGSVVAAVDLIRGLGRLVGLRVVDVPGATGYIDTNYLGKGQYALAALDDMDFVWVHVEAADEAGHEGDIDRKIEAIENMDKLVLGTILNGFVKSKEEFKILLLPDHPTPIATRAHSITPVPFLLYDSTKTRTTSMPFDERAVDDTKLIVEEGHELIKMLFEE
jgi:2,3-bisphosphoglycerate-independent phosphoglycerate mutase